MWKALSHINTHNFVYFGKLEEDIKSWYKSNAKSKVLEWNWVIKTGAELKNSDLQELQELLWLGSICYWEVATIFYELKQ